ncbi:MAG: hypothetical protein RIE08_09020 [Acidimicrobiales bacterium]
MRAKKVLRKLKDFGLEVEWAGSGHIKVRCPNGRMVVGSSSPSDHRAMKEFAADLRRNGVEIPNLRVFC